MAIKLYNTMTRVKEDFAPIKAPIVSLYTCGPTVYNYQHIGNYRTYIFEDSLKRVLMYLGYQVRHVMNITDVGHLVSQGDEGEDKMEVGAAREGKTAAEIALFYTEAFIKDCRSLHLMPPDVLCRATEHIPEQVELIGRLENKGFVYRTSDGIYFDTKKFPAYSKLAGAGHMAGLQEGARVEANKEKRSATDFALWKFSSKDKKRQMEWESPWGVGFPGWHIECSAMAMRFLGESFDLHCGGVDHIPIHHTNEIAQSEAATGKPFAHFWMHGEFLLMNSAKMAKSSGGFVTLSDLEARGFNALDYRYHCLTAHYRKQLEFSWEALESSKTARRRLHEVIQQIKAEPPSPTCEEFEVRFREAVSDDLNMPAALAVIWDALKSGLSPNAKHRMLLVAEGVLGLGLFDERPEDREVAPEVFELINRREKARREKDFNLADQLRKELDGKGVLVADTKEGQTWRKR